MECENSSKKQISNVKEHKMGLVAITTSTLPNKLSLVRSFATKDNNPD